MTTFRWKFPLRTFLMLTAFAFFASCNKDNSQDMANESAMYAKDIPTPAAKKIAKELSIHGDNRTDNYYWLNERENPDVIAYLTAENDYKEKMMEHTKGFQDKLFQEMKGRIKEEDQSVPYKDNGYWYITRYEQGQEYPIYSRKKGTLEASEEIMLNVNDLAKSFDYFNVAGLSVSPDNKILAYGDDTLSRRIYTIKFKNLETGEMLTDVIPGAQPGFAWANDNKTIFYTAKDLETLRGYKIMKHKLGTPASQDKEIFNEKDETFNAFVYRTKSDKYIVIGTSTTLSQEYHILEADKPDGKFRPFQLRERGLEYSIDHYGNKFYIRTNLDAKNFRLMETLETATPKENWKELIPNRTDVLFEGMDIFKDYLVLSERKNGITQIRIRPWKGEEHYIQFPEEAYLAYTSTNPEFDTEQLRLGYQSMTTPNSTFDYNMKSKEFKLLKRQEVLGGFDPNNYKSERVMVAARDGAKVPVSIVYRKGFEKNGKAPLLLYGYGSYGASMDPSFSSSRLSLLDRGFVFVIAHIRGGEEMGR
ncbi:MAG: oligopeptidase B, partial [Saprospiraceae bacterium]|nr:oligopeptidase B [Saprospiraceae bacterium]